MDEKVSGAVGGPPAAEVADLASQQLLAVMREVGQQLLKVGETLVNYAKAQGAGNLPVPTATSPQPNLATTMVPITSAILPAISAGDQALAGQQIFMSSGVPMVQDYRFAPKRKGDEKGDDRNAKRIRNNWTQEENEIVIKVSKDCKNASERELLSTMREKLGGNRSLTQCKNHFRNLVKAGRVSWDNLQKSSFEDGQEAEDDINKEVGIENGDGTKK